MKDTERYPEGYPVAVLQRKADYMTRRVQNHHDREDAQQAYIIGAIEGLNKHDPERSSNVCATQHFWGYSRLRQWYAQHKKHSPMKLMVSQWENLQAQDEDAPCDVELDDKLSHWDHHTLPDDEEAKRLLRRTGTPLQREVLRRYHAGETFENIGSTLGISKQATQAAYKRGLTAIQKSMGLLLNSRAA